MTKKLLFLLLFLTLFSLHAQNLVWKTRMEEGIKESNEQRKPMLILFTASTASNTLQNEIFRTPDFEVWSRDNVVLVKLDLSDASLDDSDKEQNIKLKNAFGVEELPQICFASATIRKNKTTFQALGKIGYKPGGVKSWIAESNAILHSTE